MPRIILCTLLLLAAAGSHAGAWQLASLDDAVSEARERYDGRVLSAETLTDERGREIYSIRILTPDGRVKRYRVRDGEERRRHHRDDRR